MGYDSTWPSLIGQAQSTRIRRVAWSPDGTQLVGEGDDGYVYMWDSKNGTQQRKFVGHSGVVMCVAWSPDGKWLASAGHEAEKVWNSLCGMHRVESVCKLLVEACRSNLRGNLECGWRGGNEWRQ